MMLCYDSTYFGFSGFLMYNPVGKCDVYDNRHAWRWDERVRHRAAAEINFHII